MDQRIAIVGMSATLPGGENVYESWDMIKNNLDCLDELPADRVDVTAYYHKDKTAPDKIYCTRGGFMPDFDFDTREFGMNMHQMEDSDCNQTLTLLKVKEALNDAKIEPFTGKRKNIGCVLGVLGGQKASHEFYSRLNYTVLDKVLRKMGLPETDIENAVEKYKANFPEWRLDSFPGFLTNVTAGRCTNTFNMDGINACVDAACASSLCALKIAIDELLFGNCDTMVCGATCTDCSIQMYMSFSKTPVFSTEKSVKAFDENTKGMMIGEGSCMFVLKRLADAVRDGDTIHAVIRGVASSSDGKASGIYTPTVSGQEQCIRNAYKRANVDPKLVTLVEGHGTGTRVGDKIELTALKNVFQSSNCSNEQIAVGSIKSQIGHLKAVAGFAGLVKVVLALKHKILPASINVKNPPILHDGTRIQDSPLYVNVSNRPWFTSPGVPRVAGVSSFGFGGANYHAVLEEFEEDHEKPYRMNHMPQPVLICASSVSGLITLVENEINKFSDEKDYYYDFVTTHKIGSFSFEATDARLGFVATNGESVTTVLQTALSKLLTGNDDTWHASSNGTLVSFRMNSVSGKVVALFSGQDSGYINMFSDVAMNWPQLRKKIYLMDEYSSKCFGTSMSSILYPRARYEKEGTADRDIPADATAPAVVACSAGIFDIFADAGLVADYFAGNELTAAYASKKITSEQLCEAACQSRTQNDDVGGLIKEFYKNGARVFVEFGPKQDLTEIVKSSFRDVFAISVNSNMETDSDIQIRECAMQLAVLGVSLGTFDAWEVRNPFKTNKVKKRKTTLRLSAATYTSKKTLKERERIMNDGEMVTYTISNVSANDVEKNAKLEEELKSKLQIFQNEIEITKRELAEKRQILDAEKIQPAAVDFSSIRDVMMLKKHRQSLLAMMKECDDLLQAPERKESNRHWLLSNRSVGLFATFGGQGYNVLDDLRELWGKTSIRIKDIILRASTALEEESRTANLQESGSYFKYGFSVKEWIIDDAKCPPKWYLFSAQISYPLVLLVQIVRYIDVLEQLCADHEDMIPQLKGASGHSQGVVAAVLLSTSADTMKLSQKVISFVRLLLWQGLYCSIALQKNGWLVDAKVAYDARDDTMKQSPMLSIKGVSVAQVRMYVDTVSQRYKSRPKALYLSLVNGPKLCVVSGYFDALLKLKEAVSAENPFATAAFLKVGGAFHSEINAPFVSKIVTQGERLGISIHSSELLIPVYGTHNGEDLSKKNQDILTSLVKMQAQDDMKFDNILIPVRAPGNGVTHVIDFGPNDGTAKLCNNLLRGRSTSKVIAAAGNLQWNSLCEEVAGITSILRS
uniref:Ketosynthase family 3 (KS3) domain-containing protein n=1 Tax=Aplanochytrium stocchinoi TaxID=215587 RepID=A0A7S3PF96_9STRA